jgi:uncharacterized membrane protein YfcA
MHVYYLVGANLLIGALMGLLGGLFGIGGGLIAVPVLAVLYGFDQQLAQGTALVMMIPTLLMGFWRYKQRNHIAWSTAAVLGGSAVTVTFVAAYLATNMPSRTLHLAFAIFLAFLGLYYLFNILQQSSGIKPRYVVPQKYLFVIGILMGLTSGFFGVGGAIVAVPILVAFFGVAQTAAQGMGLVAVVPGAIVALVTYANAGFVDWVTGIPLAIGGFVSVSWGVALAHHLPEKKLRIAFCGGLILLALWMLYKELF